ncbi:hypothetical protein GDO78_008914 [Eleutherodactylus coqui]|uniref:Uncharacterized protein n=1 Tax=Eleutherodactylus coqui TaxID=57060 RepID=A0A8J6FE86_ELECQ|nr:hypothetical protein GDO78_008914 [Eleutherodactylus coqui]
MCNPSTGDRSFVSVLILCCTCSDWNPMFYLNVHFGTYVGIFNLTSSSWTPSRCTHLYVVTAIEQYIIHSCYKVRSTEASADVTSLALASHCLQEERQYVPVIL